MFTSPPPLDLTEMWALPSHDPSHLLAYLLSFALLGISYADYVNIYNGAYQHESRVIAFLKFCIFFQF